VHIAARGLMTVVGRIVTVGHVALLHACEVQASAAVEGEAMVAAGAVVTPRKIVRRGELRAGNPVQKLRNLTDQDFTSFNRIAAQYVGLARA
jgi:gamma-carbonic anhydrase